MIITALAISGLSCPLQADTVKVFLMAGQSNMDGWALSQFLPGALQNPQTDVLFFNGSPSSTQASTLVSLAPDTLHGTDLNFGPEITFGRAMADNSPSSHFALIKYAVGGTSLSTDWNPTTPGSRYTQFKATVASGLQALTNAGHTPEIAGMLWLQGENDAASPVQANAYQTNLFNLIADVRSTYGANLPFIIGGIGYVPEAGRATVQSAQAYAETNLINVRYFSNDDINPNQVLHFGPSEMQTIGQRFAAEYQSIPEPSAVILVMTGLGFLILSLRRRKLAAVRQPLSR